MDSASQFESGRDFQIAGVQNRTVIANVPVTRGQSAVLAKRSHPAVEEVIAVRRKVDENEFAVFVRANGIVSNINAGFPLSAADAHLHSAEWLAIFQEPAFDGGAFG